MVSLGFAGFRCGFARSKKVLRFLKKCLTFLFEHVILMAVEVVVGRFDRVGACLIGQKGKVEYEYH